MNLPEPASVALEEGAVTTLRPRLRPPPPPPPRIFDRDEQRFVDPARQAELDDLRARFGHLRDEALIAAMARDAFAGKVAVVSSFGSESVVLLHLMAKVDPAIPVIFLNTGKLFGETLRYRDRLQDQLGLTDIRSLRPHPVDERRDDPDGDLWSRDPDKCCNFRKVIPLQKAMEPFRAELTGRKRFQTATRQKMQVIEIAGGRFKINPLADWSVEALDAYIETHRLPRHTLVADGFLSIGCMPCTQRVQPGEDYRSGRWAGLAKDECGIHDNVAGDGI